MPAFGKLTLGRTGIGECNGSRTRGGQWMMEFVRSIFGGCSIEYIQQLYTVTMHDIIHLIGYSAAIA